MNKSLPSALIPFIKQLQQLNSSKNTDEYNIEKVSLICIRSVKYTF